MRALLFKNNSPWGLKRDGNGNVYLSDTINFETEELKWEFIDIELFGISPEIEDENGNTIVNPMLGKATKEALLSAPEIPQPLMSADNISFSYFEYEAGGLTIDEMLRKDYMILYDEVDERYSFYSVFGTMEVGKNANKVNYIGSRDYCFEFGVKNLFKEDKQIEFKRAHTKETDGDKWNISQDSLLAFTEHLEEFQDNNYEIVNTKDSQEQLSGKFVDNITNNQNIKNGVFLFKENKAFEYHNIATPYQDYKFWEMGNTNLNSEYYYKFNKNGKTYLKFQRRVFWVVEDSKWIDDNTLDPEDKNLLEQGFMFFSPLNQPYIYKYNNNIQILRAGSRNIAYENNKYYNMGEKILFDYSMDGDYVHIEDNQLKGDLGRYYEFEWPSYKVRLMFADFFGKFVITMSVDGGASGAYAGVNYEVKFPFCILSNTEIPIFMLIRKNRDNNREYECLVFADKIYRLEYSLFDKYLPYKIIDFYDNYYIFLINRERGTLVRDIYKLNKKSGVVEVLTQSVYSIGWCFKDNDKYRLFLLDNVGNNIIEYDNNLSIVNTFNNFSKLMYNIGELNSSISNELFEEVRENIENRLVNDFFSVMKVGKDG